MTHVKPQETTYTLTLTETQLQAVAAATELHARLGAGQLDAVETALPRQLLGHEVDTYALRDALDDIKRGVLHLPGGMNLGNTHADAAPLSDVTWDLYQVTRHALWAARHARGEQPPRSNASVPPFLPASPDQPFAPVTRHDPHRPAGEQDGPSGAVTFTGNTFHVGALNAPLKGVALHALRTHLRLWLDTRSADTDAARTPDPRGGVYYPDLPFRPALIHTGALASIELTPHSGDQTLLPPHLLRVIIFDGRSTAEAVLDERAALALLE
ncbi:hypothetical protein [Deinococcus soli (ex Cha et al. 2016)]|uniref:Uncharacterized protein n=2 Tax=Deinococcus soli (ex Cha et al. 2016) TaxID=1309411 RepID=A0AAE4BM85_9DEIO|nr:hypothetical protein [Deinococcus soli (ex Cha et al. 2016)]MDR6218242.1 hypothetical protein [Deinococcus soli (ex Cha et al. 2016)]MDR6328982.1 hypothetical protein [Deinococcus soli (ex Cha et al. 2016)]MDR6751255.1 hypothetical protein [Deinococcus soli (ex Cha et al. 2016)]